MNLNELRDRAYLCAVKHGWHEEKLNDEHFLCLVISELMEAVEADRKEKHADIDAFNKYSDCIEFKENFERQIKNTIEDELSDVCIRLLDLAGLRQANLSYIDSLTLINVSFTEYIYSLCAFITNPDKSNIGWLDNHISYSLGWIFSWCKAKDIDIMWYIEKKMEYNELRSFKHGNKKY